MRLLEELYMRVKLFALAMQMLSVLLVACKTSLQSALLDLRLIEWLLEWHSLLALKLCLTPLL